MKRKWFSPVPKQEWPDIYAWDFSPPLNQCGRFWEFWHAHKGAILLVALTAVLSFVWVLCCVAAIVSTTRLGLIDREQEKGMSAGAETSRQRFIRNGGERNRMIRARAIQARRDGNIEQADAIDAIATGWEELVARAEREEAEERKQDGKRD